MIHFTFSWLKEHLHTEKDAQSISDTLLALGHENEITTKFKYLEEFEAAHVLEVVPHPNADRLKLCKVQSKEGELRIVCGAPNARAGIYVALAKVGQVVPSNGMEIKEVKIRGELSRGMICSASELDVGDDEDGIIELHPGAKIGEPFSNFLEGRADEDVFSLAVTPNRGDCFGVRGVARDLAAAAAGTLIPLDQVLKNRRLHKQFQESFEADVAVEVRDSTICPRFSHRVLKGIQNGPSPHWLREKLRISKVRSINKVVDATNFLLYDLNRPFHAFDLNSIKGNKLTVEESRRKEAFQGLDEAHYALPAGAIVIRDGEKVVSLAGIMGSVGSGTYDSTRDVLLESAFFPPHKVAFAAQELGIETHSRARFERGIDRDFCGLDALTQMIISLCGPCQVSSRSEHKAEEKKNTIRLEKGHIKRVIGMDVAEYRNILNSLGFEGTRDNFTIPPWRHDCTNGNDLVEEVVRVIGYKNIPSKPMDKTPQFKGEEDLKRICRLVCASRGMRESYTYCFVSEEDARAYGEQEPIRISNPMNMDMNVMRPSILPSLVESLHENISFGHGNLSLFEVGRIYARPGQSNRVNERESLSAVRFGGLLEDWRKGNKSWTPFHAKHDVLEIMRAVGTKNYSIADEAPPWYEVGQSLRLGRKVMAHFGQLRCNLTKGHPIMAFEVFLDDLKLSRSQYEKYSPCRLQPVIRDFAFIVREEIKAGQILDAIDENRKAAPLVVEKIVFDLYRDKELGEGYKSLGVRVSLLDREKNFTQSKIRETISEIEKSVCQAVDAKIRE